MDGFAEIDLDALAVRSGVAVPGTACGVVLQVAAGTIVASTPAAESMLGLTAAQMQDRTSHDARWIAVDEELRPLPGEDHPAMRVFATGRPQHDVVMGVHRPGQDSLGHHVWLSVSAAPAHDLPGRDGEAAVVSAFTLLSGRRGTELHLVEIEALARLLTENSTDMVALQRIDSVFSWVSPASTAMLGFRPDDLVGTRGLDLVHPDDADRSRRLLDATREGRPAETIITRFRHADGHYVWVETVGKVAAFGTNGSVRLQTSNRDVTKRVLAEKARDSAVALFRSAMENAPVGMALRPVDGAITEVNHAMCEMLGRSAEELRGTLLRDITHPEDSDDPTDGLDDLLAGQIPALASERRYLRPDGSYRWGSRKTVVLFDSAGLPDHILTQIVDVTERREAQEQLSRMAMTDPLTGLSNRLLLMDRLTHALAGARRNGTDVGVVFVDLDHFKAVNDGLGHDVGDELLRMAAARLRAVVREGDTAARLGGDEFVVLCEPAVEPGQVRELAEQICHALGAPFLIGDRAVTVSASVGVASGNGPSAQELLHQADSAMYGAKRGGRGRVDVFTGSALLPPMDRLLLDEDLRLGIDRDELRVVFQPIVTLPDHRLVAREALVRWAHPLRGTLLPSAFLPGAEESSLIVRIGEVVLHLACRAAAGWPDGATVHVNVSTRQLARQGFPALVAAVLDRSGLDPARLCLEVTESLALHAEAATLAAVAAVRELGVRFALDDFGTGQSSITALHQLPISSLKIDRSFVAGLPTDPVGCRLVAGLIRLGAGMGLDVIAEGIETPAQAQWLAAHDCPHGQGFLLGRPAALDGRASPGPKSDRVGRAADIGLAPSNHGTEPTARRPAPRVRRFV